MGVWYRSTYTELVKEICRIFPCFSERDRKRSSSPGQKELDHSTMKLISAELLWPSVSGRKVPSQICPQGQALGPARLVNKKLDMSEKPKKKWWKRWSPWSPFLVFRNRKNRKLNPARSGQTTTKSPHSTGIVWIIRKMHWNYYPTILSISSHPKCISKKNKNESQPKVPAGLVE